MNQSIIFVAHKLTYRLGNDLNVLTSWNRHKPYKKQTGNWREPSNTKIHSNKKLATEHWALV